MSRATKKAKKDEPVVVPKKKTDQSAILKGQVEELKKSFSDLIDILNNISTEEPKASTGVATSNPKSYWERVYEYKNPITGETERTEDIILAKQISNGTYTPVYAWIKDGKIGDRLTPKEMAEHCL